MAQLLRESVHHASGVIRFPAFSWTVSIEDMDIELSLFPGSGNQRVDSRNTQWRQNRFWLCLWTL